MDKALTASALRSAAFGVAFRLIGVAFRFIGVAFRPCSRNPRHTRLSGSRTHFYLISTFFLRSRLWISCKSLALR
ncbi:hypothetical protein CBM2586_A50451 [Cupriavidus phytorum]|uniref:Uncharacterized protein n=1 Tax=Cupriavidus taiwanensis TaxID=164546 RepID=A0A975X8E2_9BURK|nr:hypothetical protein CBM2586_A50451 [Cupriavidus taiwanensis]